MVAGSASCVCSECGVVCVGRFASCADVWARGPQNYNVVTPPSVAIRFSGGTPATRASSASSAPSAEPNGPTPLEFSAPDASAAAIATMVTRLTTIENRVASLEEMATSIQSLRTGIRQDLARVHSQLTASAQANGAKVAALEERIAHLLTRNGEAQPPGAG